jgi:AcrR family transcriptional regulator
MQATGDHLENLQVRPKRRGGRPSAAQAGDVDRRILDAAERLFLAQGFDVTNCEQVVVEAGAGKASLYARYANKEELFAAVIRHSVSSLLVPEADPPPSHLEVEERLRIAGNHILELAMQTRVVALMRLVIRTAYRFPELSKMTNSIGRDRGIAMVTRAIEGRTASGDTGAIGVATKFIEMAFVPLQMRALLGEDADALRSEGPRVVDETIGLLAAGGWLEGWT